MVLNLIEILCVSAGLGVRQASVALVPSAPDGLSAKTAAQISFNATQGLIVTKA